MSSPEIFRFPDGDEFSKWESKLRRETVGAVVSISAFGACMTALFCWLAGVSTGLILACLAFFGFGAALIWLSIRRVMFVSRALKGSWIEYDGRWVRQFDASGERIGEIDMRDYARRDTCCSNGFHWTLTANQGTEKVRVSSAVSDGVRLCRDILRVGDPTRIG